MKLIETCMEAGPMSEEDIKEALANTRHWPAMRAIVSLLEFYISQAHGEATARGQDPQKRAEACGAADYLKTLRADIIEKTAENIEGQS